MRHGRAQSRVDGGHTKSANAFTKNLNKLGDVKKSNCSVPKDAQALPCVMRYTRCSKNRRLEKKNQTNERKDMPAR